MDNQMTVKDVLNDVIKLLNGINIPVSMVETVGIPVARAINGINLCINAFDEQEKAKQAEQEPEIEIREVDPNDPIPEGAEVLELDGDNNA